MRVIIYDEIDHEPITAINLPRWALDAAEKRRYVRFYIREFSCFSPIDESAAPKPTLDRHVVTLKFEPVYRGNDLLMWLVYADDPDMALKLKSTFLAGQQGMVNRMAQEAFINGMLDGLRL